MRFLLLLCILLINVFTSYGQSQKKVGYSQLADAIFFSNKKQVSFDSVHFVNDLPDEGREAFLSTYFNPISSVTIYGGFKRYLDLKGTKKDSLGFYHSNCNLISIENCTFDDDIRFSNVIFDGSLEVVNCSFPTISDDFVGSFGQVFGGAVFVDSCRFGGSFSLLFRDDHPYRFFFKFNHSVTNGFHIELQKSTVQVKQSHFHTRLEAQFHNQTNISIDSSEFSDFEKDRPFYIELNHVNEIDIKNSSFKGATEEFWKLYLMAENIALVNNTFEVNSELFFDEANVFINKNTFSEKLALDFNSIDKTSYIDLRSFNNLNFGMLTDSYYDATSKEQISNDVAYKKYLRLNKTLYDHFKEAGDVNSANETYVRIREIENVKLNILYDSIPSFQNLFSLNLNRLLKFYTNYGTDPARALVISFYIIFVFGIFYFFFPSDWDITSKSKLIQNFKDFIEKNEKGYWKPFLILLLGIFVSIINATTLSLNAFTTLGFGNIPTHGLARYICVIQGFIGWFLLSIFTVALINQAQF